MPREKEGLVRASACGRKMAVSVYAQALGRELGVSRKLLWVLKDAVEYVFDSINWVEDEQGSTVDVTYVVDMGGKLKLLDRVVANGADGTTNAELARMAHLVDVLKAAQHFCERYDGTGVPDGLEGESIPLASRILAVAYGWASLTTDDSPHLNHDQAINKLTNLADTEFDPTIIAAARRIVKKQSLDRDAIAYLPRAGWGRLPKLMRRRPGFAKELGVVPDRREIRARTRSLSPQGG